MNFLSYLKQFFSEHSYTGDSESYEEAKFMRARFLARLDRQMTDSEWTEFGQLVRSGY